MLSTPRRIIQTWKEKTIPSHLLSYYNKWKKLCLEDNYDYSLYNDDDLRKKVEKYMPEHLDSYDSFTHNIERVDFARYAILYGEGGAYADLDTIPMKSLDSWFATEKIVLGCEPIEHSKKIYNRDTVLCNAFMISPPDQKLWKELANYIVKKYKPYGKPVYNTGPMALTLLYEKKPELFKDVIITHPCVFFPITDTEYSDKTQIWKGEKFDHISSECDLKDAYVAHLWSHEWVEGFDQEFLNLDYWIAGLMIIFIILLIFPPCRRRDNNY